MAKSQERYRNFDEFYEYYISAHKDPRNLRLHFYGTSAVITAACYAFYKDPDNAWMYVLPVGVVGYLMAWYGHFVHEKNKPATFGNPGWSFRAGLRMYRQILTREIDIWGPAPKEDTGKFSHAPKA